MNGAKAKVLAAFGNSRHRWRTARSIARDTKIPVAQVTEILQDAPEVVRARKNDARGEALFALREKHRPPDSDALAKDAGPGEGSSGRQLRYLLLLPEGAAADRLRDAVARVIRQEQGTPVLPEGSFAGASRVENLSRLIRTTDAVIADLTRGNLNVMFELGMAQGLGKPLVLLLDETSALTMPSDLLGYLYLTYNPQNLSEFTSRLARTVRKVAETREGQ